MAECKSFAVGNKTDGVLYIHWHEKKGKPVLLRTAELSHPNGRIDFLAVDIDISESAEGEKYVETPSRT